MSSFPCSIVNDDRLVVEDEFSDIGDGSLAVRVRDFRCDSEAEVFLSREKVKALRDHLNNALGVQELEAHPADGNVTINITFPPGVDGAELVREALQGAFNRSAQ